MPKSKTSSRTIQNLTKPSSFLTGMLIISLVAVGAVLYVNTSRLRDYDQLTSIPNQACVGLSNGATDTMSISIIASAVLKQKNPDNMTAAFSCLTGQGVDAATIQGKHIGGYVFGAHALYFKDITAATTYAAKKVNPLRYWGIDQAGQNAGIPQTSIFTFIVAGGSTPPYYDAYTVHNNIVLRVSLPCGGLDVPACYTQAQTVIRAFSEDILPLNL